LFIFFNFLPLSIMQNSPYIDVHTHKPGNSPGAVSIFNFLIGRETAGTLPDNWLCSVGIHPWYIDEKMVDGHLDEVNELSAGERVIAIGETGLDKLTGAPMELQKTIFIRHLAIAAQSRKPVIVHCVKAHNELKAAYKAEKSDIPLIIHGFDSNSTIAAQMLKSGFLLSFGEALFNPKSNASELITEIPEDRFFLETDDSERTIFEIYSKAAELRRTSVDHLRAVVFQNFKNCFGDLI
jgi:TatD DNase family protein